MMLLSCVLLWMIKYATGFTQRPLENMFDNFAVYSNVINVRQGQIQDFGKGGGVRVTVKY